MTERNSAERTYSMSDFRDAEGQPKGQGRPSISPQVWLQRQEFQYPWRHETDVTFDDVGGLDDVKETLRRDVIAPFKDPDTADRFGITVPNLLLHGPPGTGKTYLATALAGELGAPFVKLTGGDVTSKWINETPEEINTLFTEAERISENCEGAMIFLDEIDSVLKSRSGSNTHDEDRKAVNEFLGHLSDDQQGVVFIGATNNYESLDTAAIRNGRIDREIEIGVPDRLTRGKILVEHLERVPAQMSHEQGTKLLDCTDGWVAADIESLVTEAAREAAFGQGADYITYEHLRRKVDEITPTVTDS